MVANARRRGAQVEIADAKFEAIRIVRFGGTADLDDLRPARG